jgi:hypothetical protein
MKDKIRQWFEQHDIPDDINEGDYYISSRTYPFDVIPPRVNSETILYCTKKSCLFHFVKSLDYPPAFGAVAHNGLPPEDDVEWLRTLVGSRRLRLWGDADPADLLVYAWLREQLPIEYAGMSDRLLTKCGVELADHLTISLHDSELAALPLITECLGDLSELLGAWCSGLLSSGRKIEMEALLSCKQCTPQEMESALLLRS